MKHNRYLGLLASVLVCLFSGSCESGSLKQGPTVTGPDGDPPGQFVLQPAIDSLSPGSSSQFRALHVDAQRDSLLSAVVWSATGGVIDAGGQYTAGSTPGVYSVIAASLDGSEADTSTVIITVPVQARAVVVVPAIDSFSPGGKRQFLAWTIDGQGDSLPAAVAWSATGGSVSGAGTYTAGAMPGQYVVVATLIDGSAADTSRIVISDPASSPSHEPQGYSAFAVNPMNEIPPFGAGPSGTSGNWYQYPQGDPDVTIQSANNAPRSPNSVIQTRFNTGLPGGSAPVDLGGWDATGLPAGEKSKVYLSIWLRIVGNDFENHPTGSKMGFIAYGRSVASGQNEGFFSLLGNGSQTPASSFRIQFNQQGPTLRVLPGNTGANATFTVGTWHHWEAVWELNSGPGVADGIFRWWQDGILIASYSDIVYLTQGNTVGFNLWKWNPTWGGQNGPVRTRPDYIQIDDVYLSGSP